MTSSQESTTNASSLLSRVQAREHPQDRPQLRSKGSISHCDVTIYSMLFRLLQLIQCHDSFKYGQRRKPRFEAGSWHYVRLRFQDVNHPEHLSKTPHICFQNNNNMAERLETPLKSILNFRDVGELVNNSSSNVRLQTGQLFRGARPGQMFSQIHYD